MVCVRVAAAAERIPVSSQSVCRYKPASRLPLLWPTVTFPAMQHHCTLVSNKLDCLAMVTHRCVCKQLAERRYSTVKWLKVESTVCWIQLMTIVLPPYTNIHMALVSCDSTKNENEQQNEYQNDNLDNIAEKRRQRQTPVNHWADHHLAYKTALTRQLNWLAVVEHVQCGQHFCQPSGAE